MRYFWLNFHLPYRCRHTGACCKAGWPIPIEPERAVFLGRGQTLPQDADGACAFYNGRCTVYDHRPMSCVHFPYVCLIDARGVHVTLSHYCPTAASLLFDHQGPIEVVEGPPPIPGFDIPEGLDARESLPPLRSSQVLMSYDEFSEWERKEIDTISSIAGDSKFAPVIERFLAAKLFASWAAYDGDGITPIRSAVGNAHRVLRVEMEKACNHHGRPLDATLLLHAIRQTDLQLVHRATR
ncbi:MAG TPA: YkgJ family cysteine cluster protein [Vicinamibacterales bacterium]|nr:YkgJ family cysteine cluster protein [Vicinamibacterales bacterium]